MQTIIIELPVASMSCGNHCHSINIFTDFDTSEDFCLCFLLQGIKEQSSHKRIHCSKRNLKNTDQDCWQKVWNNNTDKTRKILDLKGEIVERKRLFHLI